MSKAFRLSVIIIVLLMMIMPTVQAQEPVVYGVFFYSPTCPHCHKVMNEDWPGIEARFGEQLKVLFVDITTRDGQNLMLAAMDSVPLSSTGVPQLIIGDHILVGDVDIPVYAPTIIEQGLAAGGIGYPNIPNIDSWFTDAGFGEFTLTTNTASVSADPANYVAIGVFIFLVLSLLLIAFAAWQVMGQNNAQLLTMITTQIGWWLLLISSLTGFGLALTLLFGSDGALVMGLSILIALVFIGSVGFMANKSTLRDVPNWFVPLTMIVGVVVAAYMSYVEFNLSDAVCGAMGDCNTVQQSDYAYIGGIPIGFIGLAAYVVMLLIWVFGRGEYKQLGDSVLLLLTVLGTLFSAYLTFLEPFVIHATCVWCLTSAITMLSLLWLIAPTFLEGILTKPKRHKPYDKAPVPSA